MLDHHAVRRSVGLLSALRRAGRRPDARQAHASDCAPFATAATPSAFPRRRCAICMRIIDLQPAFTYLVGITSIALTKSGKRLGDIVAGTIVVREALVQQPLRSRRRTLDAGRSGASHRAAHRRRVSTSRTMGRATRTSLEPERRRQLVGAGCESRFGTRFPTDDGDERKRGARSACSTRERRAREHGAAARGATGASRERYAIVTTSSPRWIAFASKLAEAQRRGLTRSAKPAFATSSPSTARCPSTSRGCAPRSRGESTDELFYLGRLVAGAHNLLYRERARRHRGHPSFHRGRRSDRSTPLRAPDRPRRLVHVRAGDHRVHRGRSRSGRRRDLHPDADARSRRRRRHARAQRGRLHPRSPGPSAR